MLRNLASCRSKQLSMVQQALRCRRVYTTSAREPTPPKLSSDEALSIDKLPPLEDRLRSLEYRQNTSNWVRWLFTVACGFGAVYVFFPHEVHKAVRKVFPGLIPEIEPPEKLSEEDHLQLIRDSVAEINPSTVPDLLLMPAVRGASDYPQSAAQNFVKASPQIQVSFSKEDSSSRESRNAQDVSPELPHVTDTNNKENSEASPHSHDYPPELEVTSSSLPSTTQTTQEKSEKPTSPSTTSSSSDSSDQQQKQSPTTNKPTSSGTETNAASGRKEPHQPSEGESDNSVTSSKDTSSAIAPKLVGVDLEDVIEEESRAVREELEHQYQIIYTQVMETLAREMEEWKAEEKKKMNSEVKRKIREETRDFATEKLVLEDLIQQQAYQLRDIELNLENFKASIVQSVSEQFQERELNLRVQMLQQLQQLHEKRMSALNDIAAVAHQQSSVLDRCLKRMQNNLTAQQELARLAYKLDAQLTQDRYPFLDTLDALVSVSNDPLIATSIEKTKDNLSQEAKECGVSSLQALTSRFKSVSKVARKESFVSEESPGLLAQVYAEIMGVVTVPPARATMECADSLIANASTALENGDLAQAYAELQKVEGRAACALKDWMQAASDRLLMDQVLCLVKASSATPQPPASTTFGLQERRVEM